MRANIALVAILAFCNSVAARELLGAPRRLPHLVFGRYIATNRSASWSGSWSLLRRMSALAAIAHKRRGQAGPVGMRVEWRPGVTQRHRLSAVSEACMAGEASGGQHSGYLLKVSLHSLLVMTSFGERCASLDGMRARMMGCVVRSQQFDWALAACVVAVAQQALPFAERQHEEAPAVSFPVHVSYFWCPCPHVRSMLN